MIFFDYKDEKIKELDPRAVNFIPRYVNLDGEKLTAELDWCNLNDFNDLNLDTRKADKTKNTDVSEYLCI